MAIRRPLVFSVLATFAAATAVAGCASGGGSSGEASLSDSSADSVLIPPPPSGPLEKTHLDVYAPPTADAAGLYIAEYKHLFQQAGLTVTIHQAPSDEQVINDQALGGIDVTVGNYVSYFEAQENFSYKGMQPQTFKGTQGGVGGNIPMFLLSADVYIVAEASIVAPGYAGLFVEPGSGINSVADLKGKAIGINAKFNDAYLMISSFLDENGVPTDSVQYREYPYPRMQQALTNHKIQVAYLAEPYASMAEAAGLVRLTDLVDGNTQDFPLAGYAVTKQWAKRYPNTLQAFLHALEQGQQLADTSRQVAEDALVAEVPGLNQQTAAMLALETYPVGRPDVTRLQRVLDSAERFGVITGNIFTAELVLPGSGS